MLAVRSWTTGNHNFIQAKNLFTHMLINIVGESDSKANEEQNSMTEEDLKNNIILDIVSSIDIF